LPSEVRGGNLIRKGSIPSGLHVSEWYVSINVSVTCRMKDRDGVTYSEPIAATTGQE